MRSVCEKDEGQYIGFVNQRLFRNTPRSIAEGVCFLLDIYASLGAEAENIAETPLLSAENRADALLTI